MPGNIFTVTAPLILTWPKPNYADPPERREWLGAFAITWQAVSTVLVLVRMYLRGRGYAGRLGCDDWLIFSAWIFSLCFTTTACFSDWVYHMGRHVWNFEPQHYVRALQVGWFTQATFLIAMTFTKCSVLLCYRRWAKASCIKTWGYAIWILLFVTASSGIAMFVSYCLICRPLQYYWNGLLMDIRGTPGKCISGDGFTITFVTLTIASDLWAVAFPCLLFHRQKLNVTKGQRILVNCLFCTGFLVTGVGIARAYFQFRLERNQDISWSAYNLYIAATVELQLAIICACLPFTRTLFRHFSPKHNSIGGRVTPGTTTSSRGSESYVLDGKSSAVLMHKQRDSGSVEEALEDEQPGNDSP